MRKQAKKERVVTVAAPKGFILLKDTEGDVCAFRACRIESIREALYPDKGKRGTTIYFSNGDSFSSSNSIDVVLKRLERMV